MTVEMKPISSANLASVGYDPETRELHVAFRSGPTYIHSDVSADHHAEMIAAESPGKHYFAKTRGQEKHPHRIKGLPGS